MASTSSDNSISSFKGGQVSRRKLLAATVGGGLALPSLARGAGITSRVRVLDSPEQLRSSYDHVIVGAGSAGCVLAHRLGQAGRRVLMIEAGGQAELAVVKDPQEWPTLQASQFDWRYVTVPQSGLGGRVIRCPRGKAVGGSSVINAVCYQRGHSAAYDRWPEGWRAKDLLPYFKRAETFSGGANAWRGGDGPLRVLSLADVPAADRNPVSAAFVKASQDMGFRMTPDIGGEVTTGVGWNQVTLRDGIARANDSVYGLGGTAWGGRISIRPSRWEPGWRRAPSGLVSLDVSFGGAKQSRIGRELGQEGLEAFTQVKIINMAK